MEPFWLDGRTAVAIVAAHPDDEVIGTGGTLLRLRARRSIIHVTDGAPRDGRDARTAGFETCGEYARARRAELEAALAYAAIAPSQCSTLGVADQQASLHMALLARRLADAFAERAVHVVITHAYEGGHPDHDATAFAVHAAARLAGRHQRRPLRIYEMTGYHAAPGGVRTGRFLPSSSPVATVHLSHAERGIKRAMLDCFRTQQGVLDAFGVDRERFRPAPAYEFSRPPHDGPLFYEHFDWGMTGPRWRALAACALADLQLEGACG